ncbi:M1 family metallopeptidase [Nocardioides nanhaiensis]|uniref:Aminopeptidase N n=1 Tax=Nocardioides nanhaiensis TaxID=1476871 RepID=A0ABP8VXC5_9ACTN
MSLPTADGYLPGHGDPCFSVRHYDLALGYAVESNRLDGLAELQVEVLEPTRRLVLDLARLEVAKVRLDGAGLKRWSTRSHRLLLDLADEVDAGTTLTLTVRYSGRPRPLAARHLGEAGWEELTDGVIVAGQPHGAPTWFPCNDRPDDKASYRIAVTAPTGYHVVANGVLASRTRSGSTVTWAFEQEAPMATYLATVQVGRYRNWGTQRTGSGVPVRVFAPDDLDVEAHEAAFGRQVEMVETFERLFGPYPFPAYGVVVTGDDLEIPLESQSLSTFGRNLVRGDWDATRLVAHELAHQWFGNAVTLRHWRDIWLHEGFACYSEWLWSEESGQASTEQRARRKWEGLEEKPQDLLLTDPGPELMFDDRVYKRGALALHTLRVEAGDEPFFDLLRSWVAEHRDGSVTTEQFLAHASQSTALDVEELLHPWLHETELPPFPE